MPDEPTVNRPAERAAKRGSQSNPEATPEEVRYSTEALLESSAALLGVTRHTVVGALYGQDRKTFTLDEAKSLIEEFLTREHT